MMPSPFNQGRDLIQIGAAAVDMPLLCGGSGIAMGLPANHGLSPRRPGWSARQGPGVVLSGSCSRATRAQVAAYLPQAPSQRIDADTAIAGKIDVEALAEVRRVL